MAHAIGVKAATELGWKKNRYTRAELRALGEQLIVDHALHGDHATRARLLVTLARTERKLDLSSSSPADSRPAADERDTLADQVSNFLIAGFKDELAISHAAADLAALRPPTRPALARELLAGIGLEPDRPIATAPAGNAPKKAADHYFERDKLSADDIRNMGAPTLTDAEVANKLASLPDSLEAEFSRRFDVYIGLASEKTLVLFDNWLSWIGAKLNTNLDDARIEIHTARLEYFRRGAQVTLNRALPREDRTRKEVPAVGYIATIHAAGKRHQYFLSTLDGGVHAIPTAMSAHDWATRHTGTVFGLADGPGNSPANALSNGPSDKNQNSKSPNLHTRVALSSLGEGRRADLRTWLTPLLPGHHEKSRAAARAQTPAQHAVDMLLDFIPFRRMTVAIRSGDFETALLSGAVDLITIAVPMIGAELRLATGAARGLIPAARTIGRELATEGIARAGAAATSRQEMRTAIKAALQSLSDNSGLAHGLRPLDADGMAAALRGSHPRVANALERVAARAHGIDMQQGWRLADTPAAAAAGEEISTLKPATARGPGGDTVSLLSYGGDTARAYTRVKATGERTGVVLLADREGWLHPSLPADTLENYAVNALDLLRELATRRPGADGVIEFSGKHYARIADTHVEIAPEHASTAARPAWRVVARDGAQRDIVFHRIAYDTDKAIWRRADIPELKGGGNSSAHPTSPSSPAGQARASSNISPPPEQAHGSPNRPARNPLRAAAAAAPNEIPAELPSAAPGWRKLSDFKQLLVTRIAGTPADARISAVRNLLNRMQADPRGMTILNAMHAYHELTGRAPDIVVREGANALEPRPSLSSSVRTARWNLDADALNGGPPDAAVNELAAVYNNMTGILQGVDPFVEMLRDGRPLVGAEEEAAWANWVGEDKGHHSPENPTVFIPSPRQAAVDELRIQLRMARCHGGIDRSTLIQVLRNVPGASIPGLKLNLSGLRITEIPPLPADLHSLSIDDNPIADWSRLPQNLKCLEAARTGGMDLLLDQLPPGLLELDITDNLLETIPAYRLPRGLARLQASYNRLSQIPAGLPDTLRHLILDDNALTAWPAELPRGLRVLDVAANQLNHLPGNLPPDLERLDLSENFFQWIPDGALPPRLKELGLAGNPDLDSLPKLGEALEVLYVESTGLTSLPEDLPRGLKELYAGELGLTRLPDNLPRGLRVLVATDNELTALPPSITELTRCDVYLDNNPISQGDLPPRPDGQDGPVFHLSLTIFSGQPGASRTVEQAVAHWFEGHDDRIATRWESIAETLQATDHGRRATKQFWRFLDKLRGTPLYRSKESRAHVREWLGELSKPEREPLLKSTLEMCAGAAESCEDGVTLVWNELRKLRVNDDIRLGRYNDRPADALQIMKQLFREKKLQDIAYRKIAASPALDDVEVYLAYIVRLREPLALPMAPKDMLFFNISEVTQADLDAALREVRTAERNDFYKDLVVDDTWNALIKQKLPAQHAQAEDRLVEQATEPLKEKIRAELRLRGLDPDDADAYRNIAPATWRDMKYDILEPLTRECLNAAGIPLPAGAEPGIAAAAPATIGVHNTHS